MILILILFLQIYPLRISTCNLHGGDTTSGLTMLLQHVRFKQYAKISSNLVCSSVYSLVSHGQSSQQTSATEMWLEVGGFSLGPIYIDAATSQLKRDAGILQEKFLKVHDKKKRLWFLWGSDTPTGHALEGKCGCVGGCTFFGNNKNGMSFFVMSNYMDEAFVTAKYHISSDSSLGFGESILHKGHFVFEIPETVNVFYPGYSPTQSENSFNVTDVSHQHSAHKTQDSTSKSSDVAAQLISRGQSALSESFLNDKFCPFHQNRVNCETKDQNCDFSTYIRENKHSQMRNIKRQFSSPTHMSMPSSSSILSSFQMSMAQSAPITCKHERKVLMKSDELKNTLDSSAGYPSHVKEGSVSPGLSQNRYSSRASLNTCVNGRGESNGSRHSLASITARNYSPRSIRRAASTESTHSTESYFSADEDAVSSVDTTDTTTSEEVQIEEEKHHTVIKNGLNSFDRRVSATRRSLHDIQETPSQISSESDIHVTVLQRTPSCGHPDPSDSNSVSSTSFLSAVSSQEDIALVDLHNQMDKPIIESPLLMSCYMAHMTQLQCHYWFQHPPLPHLVRQAKDTQTETAKDFSSAQLDSSWKPKFLPLTEGFTSIHMIEKSKIPYYRQKFGHFQKSASNHCNEEFHPGSSVQEFKKGDFFHICK